MMPRWVRKHARYAFYSVCRCISAPAMMVLTGVRHFDVPEIRGGLLIASNHQSYLDPVLVGMALERPIHYLARRELFRVPGFGTLIKALGAHPVKRGHADAGALRTAMDLLRRGEALLVFPEGTRTRDGQLGEFRPGVGALAVRCGVPVLPVCIEGAYRCWPRSRLLPRPARVAVAYGEIIETKDRDGREVTEAIAEHIGRLHRFLRDHVRGSR